MEEEAELEETEAAAKKPRDITKKIKARASSAEATSSTPHASG